MFLDGISRNDYNLLSSHSYKGSGLKTTGMTILIAYLISYRAIKIICTSLRVLRAFVVKSFDLFFTLK